MPQVLRDADGVERGGAARSEQPTHYRTIWISDIHLGTRGCKAELPARLPAPHRVRHALPGRRHHRRLAAAQSLVLAQTHNDVVQKLLRKARKGTRVIYVPGNHDEMLRALRRPELRRRRRRATRRSTRPPTAAGCWSSTATSSTRSCSYARWLAFLGDRAYTVALKLNQLVQRVRAARSACPTGRCRQYLKHKVKNAVELHRAASRTRSPHEARRRGVDGVVCGHIHNAEMREIDGVLYCNDGDWVESCTALVEHVDGTLEILHWADRRALHMMEPGAWRRMTPTRAARADESAQPRSRGPCASRSSPTRGAPQVNGVVRTLTETQRELMALGHSVMMIAPERFRTVPCPTYPEIRLSLAAGRAVRAAAATSSGRTPCTSRPKGRSAGRRARIASSATCRSPPPITPAFRNTSRARFGVPLSLALCGAAALPCAGRARDGADADREARLSRPGASATSCCGRGASTSACSIRSPPAKTRATS